MAQPPEMRLHFLTSCPFLMFVRLLSWSTGSPAPSSLLASPNHHEKTGMQVEASICPTCGLEGVGVSSLCPSLQPPLFTTTTTTDRFTSSASFASQLIYRLCSSSSSIGGGGCISTSTSCRSARLSPKSPQRRHCLSSRLPLHRHTHRHTHMHMRDLLLCPADDAGRWRPFEGLRLMFISVCAPSLKKEI